MTFTLHDRDLLAWECRALQREYADAQTRCTARMQAQAKRIERLEADQMRLRAAVIVRDTALAWADERHAALEASIPGLPRRVVLARQVETLMARVRDLVRERWTRLPDHTRLISSPEAMPGPGAGARLQAAPPIDDIASLEASLVAADLVICQTGCLSHGAYWRVQDHCKRTGKACVLVREPDALRIVRIHKAEASAEL